MVGNDDGLPVGVEVGSREGSFDGDNVGIDEGITLGVEVFRKLDMVAYKAFADASPQFSPFKHFLAAQLQVGLVHFVHFPH